MSAVRHPATFVLLALLNGVVACAGAPRAPGGAVPRIKDTASARAAAPRAVHSDLNLETEDQRSGFEAAGERRQRSRYADGTTAPSPTATGPANTNRFTGSLGFR